ncbi:MAG: septum formation inhibitor Maf [Desulfobulbaceae bacterium]|uniref:dTTP/UTP pyrophosphatase n=1 Tax=Candidatus Desulfatifera sulfidica TaxID=2841691 RepID=A0A8J6TCW4_9BACT|nr:septum formation inhibitor Maf [Candidatus Desulfatifera sulfidica]
MGRIFCTQKSLILASASPRRQQFLTELGLEYQVQAAEINETPHSGELPLDFVRRMAREKAMVVAESFPQHWIAAADTIVVLEGEILGKPASAHGAQEMLMRLSGREHVVLTGFSLVAKNWGVAEVSSVATRVVFQPFSAREAQAYVATGEPMDKAGSYGIQGLGAFLVKELRGSYTNVVGLPLVEFLHLLQKHGVAVPCGS